MLSRFAGWFLDSRFHCCLCGKHLLTHCPTAAPGSPVRPLSSLPLEDGDSAKETNACHSRPPVSTNLGGPGPTALSIGLSCLVQNVPRFNI